MQRRVSGGSLGGALLWGLGSAQHGSNFWGEADESGMRALPWPALPTCTRGLAAGWCAPALRFAGPTDLQMGLNAVRVHASPSSFRRDMDGFVANFAAFLHITGRLNISVLPVLFGTGDIKNMPHNVSATKLYLEEVVARFANEPGIMGFDVCNECYSTGSGSETERATLKDAISAVKAAAAYVFTG